MLADDGVLAVLFTLFQIWLLLFGVSEKVVNYGTVGFQRNVVNFVDLRLDLAH